MIGIIPCGRKTTIADELAKTGDICPSRDMAQPHIFEGDKCVMCLTAAPNYKVYLNGKKIIYDGYNKDRAEMFFGKETVLVTRYKGKLSAEYK